VLLVEGKVVFCTGGYGSICSAQVEALVLLGANAAICGRQIDKAQRRAAEIQSLRKGSQVIPVSADVRSITDLENAVAQTVKLLGGIDFCM
jgi:2,4-dienoyl-CoA reductase [(3E)-enoyl-CoA-producing], peroxisomal